MGNPISTSPLTTIGGKVIYICFVVLQTCPDSCNSDMLDFELDTGIGGDFGIGFLQGEVSHVPLNKESESKARAWIINCFG